MADPLQVLREHIPDDYLGPDPNNQFSGERYGQHPEALAALAQVEALVEAAAEVLADGGVDDIDPRLSYVNVQMSRPTLPALAAALAPFKDTT